MAAAIRWLVNGVNLHATYARTIPSSGDAGGMFHQAPLRGENVVIPGRPGELFVPKVRGAARVSVPLLLRGATSTGAVPPSKVPAFLENLRALHALLSTPGAPLTLARQLDLPTGTITETGEAEIEPDSLTPNLYSPFLGVAVLRFRVLNGTLLTAGGGA